MYSACSRKLSATSNGSANAASWRHDKMVCQICLLIIWETIQIAQLTQLITRCGYRNHWLRRVATTFTWLWRGGGNDVVHDTCRYQSDGDLKHSLIWIHSARLVANVLNRSVDYIFKVILNFKHAHHFLTQFYSAVFYVINSYFMMV